MILQGALALALLLPGPPGTEDGPGAPEVRIVQPAADRSALGETLFVVEARAAAGRRLVAVRLFVDGRLVATLGEPPYQARFDAGQVPHPHTLRAEAEDDAGQVGTDLATTLYVSFFEEVGVQARRVPRQAVLVSVVDKKGRPILDIKPEELALRVDGRPEPLLEASLDRRPLAASLVLDVSGSILPHWSQVLLAADVFLSMLQPEDGSEVRVFAGATLPLAPFGQDHVAHREALLRLRFDVGTMEVLRSGSKVYDALAGAVESINVQPGQRTITLFTDALDTGSRLGLDQVAEVVRRSGIRLDLIRFGRKPVGAYVESTRIIQRLRDLAEETGGREWRIKQAEDVVPTFAGLAREIGGRYRLVFAPDPGSRKPGRPRRLAVSVSRAGARVLAPGSFVDGSGDEPGAPE